MASSLRELWLDRCWNNRIIIFKTFHQMGTGKNLFHFKEWTKFQGEVELISKELRLLSVTLVMFKNTLIYKPFRQ